MNCYKCKIQWDYPHLQRILCPQCKGNSNFYEKELPKTLAEAIKPFQQKKESSIMPLYGKWNATKIKKLN